MRALLLAAALFIPALAAAAPTMNPVPSQPMAGDMLRVQLDGWSWPIYAPATRYTRAGNTFTVDLEYASDFFGPTHPAFTTLPVPLSELKPGTYTVQTRLHNMAQPGAAPQTFSTSVNVGMDALGVRVVPASPQAQRPFEVIVSSMHYFDPATVRLYLGEAGVVRVDYQYEPSAPVTQGSVPPPGLVAWTAVSVPALPARDYWMYAVGAERTGTHYYVAYNPMVIRASVDAIEYYAEQTDRYFFTTTQGEIDILDRPGSAWKRTGQRFRVYAQAADAPSGSLPLCRFYAANYGAHYHTPIASECQWLRDVETQQRAKAQTEGSGFNGWAYEGVAFHAQVPTNGVCPQGTTPVNRSSDGAHRRYTTDGQVYASMSQWTQEGAVFCSPN